LVDEAVADTLDEAVPTKNVNPMRPIRTWQNVNRDLFRGEIAPLGRPAVLKGLVRDWPSVQEGLKSPQVLWHYIRQFDCGRSVLTSRGAASMQGRFFYRDDLRGPNFEDRLEPLSVVA